MIFGISVHTFDVGVNHLTHFWTEFTNKDRSDVLRVGTHSSTVYYCVSLQEKTCEMNDLQFTLLKKVYGFP